MHFKSDGGTIVKTASSNSIFHDLYQEWREEKEGTLKENDDAKDGLVLKFFCQRVCLCGFCLL